MRARPRALPPVAPAGRAPAVVVLVGTPVQSVAAARWAAAVAAQRSLPLLVVVLDDEPDSLETAQALLARAGPSIAAARVPYETCMVDATGPARRTGRAVLDLLAGRETDLLVLGDDGSALVSRLVERATCDVLVVLARAAADRLLARFAHLGPPVPPCRTRRCPPGPRSSSPRQTSGRHVTPSWPRPARAARPCCSPARPAPERTTRAEPPGPLARDVRLPVRDPTAPLPELDRSLSRRRCRD